MTEPARKRIGLFETRPGYGGGTNYQKAVARALGQKFNLTNFRLSPKVFPNLSRPRMLARMMWLNWKESSIDLWIRNWLGVVGMHFLRPESRNIALFFHLDPGRLPHQWLTGILLQKFWENLSRCDKVVVISKYWENFMKDRGVENTRIIYPGIDASRFVFRDGEIDEFKEKYGLTGKPIIYLGNCQENKGVREAYENLKDLPYHLVTSGRKEMELPALNLELTYREYVRLLKSAAVVLTMSKFLEGWNITAHEAMLCRTPVIGSGSGGMGELLAGGRQIVCDDFKRLPEWVDYAITNSERLGNDGYRFAQEFTFEKFQENWIELVTSL